MTKHAFISYFVYYRKLIEGYGYLLDTAIVRFTDIIPIPNSSR